MIKFIYDVMNTWIHILVGLTFLGSISLFLYISYSYYIRYIDEKESRTESEMDKLRNAMRINKNDIDSMR